MVVMENNLQKYRIGFSSSGSSQMRAVWFGHVCANDSWTQHCTILHARDLKGTRKIRILVTHSSTPPVREW